MAEDRRRAFHTFIASVEHELIGSVWHILRDSDEADDAYQATLVRLWECFPAVMRHPNPRALAIRIAVNAALDRYRKRTREQSRKAHDVAADNLGQARI